jgi:hypothetical protein
MKIKRNGRPRIWFLILFLGLLQTVTEPCLAYSDVKNESAPIKNELTFLNQVDIFFDNLVKLSEPGLKKIFMDYSPVIAKELDITNLYTTSYPTLETLLEYAVLESIDALSLFTHPRLQQKNNKAIVLNKAVLLKLSRQFNLHGLFLITTKSADDDTQIQMDFLVAGQGKFIVGYDKNTTIIHPDYHFATGRYDYYRFFLMDIGTDGNGERGMFDIKGLTTPSGSFKNMMGPLNATIKSLSLISREGDEKKILIRYEMFGTQEKIIPRMVIEKIFKNN